MAGLLLRLAAIGTDMFQKTIKKQASISGIGLHTGRVVNLNFIPADADHGIKFKRIDLADQTVIAADVNKVASTNRGTTLSQGVASVHTIEHVLAALTGLGIDNVLIEVDGPEIPILDGSSSPFIQVLEEAGIEDQEIAKDYFVVTEPISFRDELTGSELIALPADHYEVTTLIDFNSPVLGQQFATLSHIDDFKTEIAPCRTFVFLHELEHLLSQGLIKGGDLDNAIVIADRTMNQTELDELAHKLGKPSIKIEKEGVLNTVSLYFKNEPARHKLLDVIGDLTLLGKPIKGKIVATKPGHSINVEFTKLLKKHYLEQRKLKGIPIYDPSTEPLLDTSAIMGMLPHRFPFLLVDKIIEMGKDYVVGVKNISFTESCFEGHFPDNPVYPGVLQIEALAQTGGILALSTVSDPENWDTYFLKIESAKFKSKVLPGDTLILKMELIEPIRRGIVHMQGIAYVGNKIVSEADLTAQIVNRTTLKT